MEDNISERIRKLTEKGVMIIDPRQTYISGEVDLDRIYKGCALYPGTRLTGARTLIGSFAQIGTEGPAAIHDTIIGSHAEVASGYLTEATLLPGAQAGANSHFRAGTLLEEKASTAHTVGLKQTILMYGVTFGSLINFCDALVSGGRSRAEHTEVGSGFIHFNFTPWGRHGDKATPSLVGNVTDGVFLDRDRIFLGGMSGIVGPLSVGFGAITVAGQVVRDSVADSNIRSDTGGKTDKDRPASDVKRSDKRLERIRERNIEFIAQLFALNAWYVQVRLRRSRLQENPELSLVLTGAIETIRICINERTKRYNSFAEEWSLPVIDKKCLYKEMADPEFSVDWNPELDHDKWVWGLDVKEKQDLKQWLASAAENMKNTLLG